MEELSEALKAVEKQLNFARKAYRSIVYLYWAVAFPVIYVVSSVVSAYTGMSVGSGLVLLSAAGILLFVVEESRALRNVIRIETALGRKRGVKVKYLLAQLIVWPIVILAIGLNVKDQWLMPLLSIGAGMTALAVLGVLFKERWQENAMVGAVILLSSIPYRMVPITKGAYTTLVLSAAFGFAAYCSLRKAMRE
ncbi:hypothetical protein [Thermococcus sp.]